jgi:hypothetical protein
MNVDTNVIMQALAPGVALTSMIFYYGNLQSRMVFTVETIRALNREARELQAPGAIRDDARVDSIRWQVEFLARRFRNIHQAMLLVYGGFGSLIVTIVALLVMRVFQAQAVSTLALVTFTMGLAFMGAATIVSSRELRLARKTILEDIDSSHDWSMVPARTAGTTFVAHRP